MGKIPTWSKLLLAANVTGLAVVGGQKLSTDSPVHLAVVGQVPEQAEGWVCEPEGGLIGAPVVCRPKAELTGAVVTPSTDSSTSTAY